MSPGEDIHAPERRQSGIEGTSASAHLARIEDKLDRLARSQETQDRAIRALEDWRIEMSVYMRQLRWTLVMAGGALLVGTVNILLEVLKRT